MIRRFEIGLEIRHRGVMSWCTIEDKTAVVVVALYRCVLRNPVRLNALYGTLSDPRTLTLFDMGFF